MQGADGVVKLLAALVVAAHALAQHLHQPRIGDLGLLFLLGSHGQRLQRLQRVEQAACVTIGIGYQLVYCYFFNSWLSSIYLGFSHYLL